MIRYLLLIATVACAVIFAKAQVPTSALEALYNVNTMQGTEFWIAIPPNEVNPYPVQGLEIYIASAYDADVVLFDASSDRTIRRKVRAYEILTLSDRTGETNWTWEIREFEQVVRKGIRITSTKPVCVYVINSKIYTSDGYLAIPVSGWGASYIHVGYYDFRESRHWAGGFVVVASEDGTNVEIALKGTGGNSALTAGGKRIGDMFSFTLDAGDVYMVKGDATTRGEFDLTGSSITANKPIGLISFHERTTMPNMLVNGNGRNHLVEMMPPVSTWGKQYVTVEYSRENNNGQGKGDVFRVVARDADTRWSLKYYDKNSKQLIGQGGGYLSKAGEFADISQSGAPTTLPYGFSVWEADKPIHVMQYSCSSSWDGDPNLDPFMINVTPEEQFLQSAIFQFPTMAEFSKNRLNLIVKTDPNDPNVDENLKSLVIDGTPVWNHPRAESPTLLFTHMGDGFYWTRLDFDNTRKGHSISCNEKVSFGGYIYGFGLFDAYGWQLGGSIAELGSIDTMPPIMEKVSNEAGRITFVAKELRNIPVIIRADPEETDQVEKGIARIDTVLGMGSKNVVMQAPSATELRRTRRNKQAWFSFTVANPRLDAHAVFYVQDWANNRSIDSITCLAGRPVDSLRPVIEAVLYAKGVYTRRVTEIRSNSIVPTDCLGTKFQEESGLKAISFVLADIVNMRYTLLSQTTFTREPRVTEARYTWTVIDSTKDAHCYYSVTDWAGNVVSDTIRYAGVTSLDSEPIYSAQIAIHPNPTQSVCTVSWGSNFFATRVDILDLLGNNVFSGSLENMSQISIDVSAFASGVYVIRVTGSNGLAAPAFLVR